jgi:hypothetical protein
MAEFAQTTVIWPADDDMVNHFNFKELTGANQIAGDCDVCLAGTCFAAYAAYGISGVIPHPVLCRMACDLPWFSLVNLWLDAA